MTTQPKTTTIWDRKTLTGKTLAEVYSAIDADLGKGAYAGIFGTNLTDIKPPFVYELLTECFGPCGIGWGYDVLSSEYQGSEEKTSKKGREYVEFYATARVVNWYRLPDDESPVLVPESVGGSANEVRHYAMQGAITNAVGNGWSRFGVQRHIYKNQPAPDEDKLSGGVFGAADRASEKQVNAIYAIAKKLGTSELALNGRIAQMFPGREHPADLSPAEASELIAKMDAALAKEEA